MAPAKSFTPKQGQYLAFIYAYTRLHRRPPAEADMQQYFQQFTRWCSRSNGQGSFGDNRGSLATSKSSLIRSTCQFYADPQINPSKPLC
jgi:hypothetical protein